MKIFFKKNQKVKVKGNYKTSVFRKYQNLYLKKYCNNLPVNTVLNVGAKPNAGDKEGDIYENYFFNAENFFTLDLMDLPENYKDKERHLKGNLLDLSTFDKKFDLILIMSVIEHLENPFKMSEELKKILTPQGYIYIAMPFFYPVHETPEIRDYWRMTPDGVKLLFNYCNVIKQDYYPSVLEQVRDRDVYWDNENSTYSGFSMLFQRNDET